MRNELLDKTGHSPGFGPIYRDKKTKSIIADVSAYSGGSIANNTYSEISNLISKKVKKGYSETTDLIVSYNCYDASRYPPSDSAINLVRSAISPPIRTVYCINLNDNYIWKAA
jgi:hypothetical protein